MPKPQLLERTFEIERGSIDLETGKFPMVLASEGEATDGHVLNLRGATVPDQMPLQVAHANSPLETLGSITQAKLGTKGNTRVLRAMGEIEMGGEGPKSDIRRDLAFMVSEGHINSISLRAEGTKVIPRRELPKNHRAFVEPSEPDMLKRFGLFFEEFNALEGSIVAIGADRNAIIGRSNETTGAVQEFWRGFVVDEDDCKEELTNQLDELDTSLKEANEQAKRAVVDAIVKAHPDVDTSNIQDVRSLERFLGEMPGISRKEAKRLSSIKIETAQPSRDAKEETPELTIEEIREIVRGEFTDTMADIHTEVSALLSDTLGKVRVR